ncbi:baseplate J/gp47 family protein [Denitromonas sp.]|uniref:baseplate J/gp47 family protein n=1 Tax=Denitromonas sp. TaxID=2734609 RepID=UPI003A85DAE3
MIDLSRLPAPNVIEPLDFETLLAERKARLLELTPEAEREAVAAVLALESEPITKLLQENAYRELALRQRINEAGKAVMLPWSKGTDLDNLAANYDLERFTLDPGDADAVPPMPPTYEPDDELRERSQLAYEGLSVAGPRLAYIKHGRDADPRVADISAVSPAPCTALITVLARDGDGTATADLLAAVDAALTDEDMRPLGDRVTVQSATVVPYTVDATLHLYPGPESEPIMAEAEARLQAYIAAHRRIGRDIRRSALYAVLHVEGVQRVELAEPAADVVIDTSQAAYCTGYTITLGAPDD